MHKWRVLQLGAKWDKCYIPIYEALSSKGSIPLLKTLLTNKCTNECLYCAFRVGCKRQRVNWNPEKLAKITVYLWRLGYIKGLFLSSSIQKDPDLVVEKQLEVVKLLREKEKFVAYIHLRLMPGVSRNLIEEAAKYADRIGINIEAPNKEIFDEICPDKGDYLNDVIKRLKWASEEAYKARIEAKKYGFKYGFSRAGVDTQLVIGVSEDTDLEHLKTTDYLYKHLKLKRVYYSGFEPIPGTPLENKRGCPPFREYRLYQASFLIRDYKISLKEISRILDENEMLPNVDPKLALAKLHREIFPLDLNSASYKEILMIPGIGPNLARKIIAFRNTLEIKCLEDLERILGSSIAKAILPYVKLKSRRITDYEFP